MAILTYASVMTRRWNTTGGSPPHHTFDLEFAVGHNLNEMRTNGLSTRGFCSPIWHHRPHYMGIQFLWCPIFTVICWYNMALLLPCSNRFPSACHVNQVIRCRQKIVTIVLFLNSCSNHRETAMRSVIHNSQDSNSLSVTSIGAPLKEVCG